MRAAAEVLESSAGLGEILADGIVRQLAYSSWIFAGVVLLTWVLRKRSPTWRYALWSLVLVRLLLPPDLTSPFSARQVYQNFFGVGSPVEGVRVDLETHGATFPLAVSWTPDPAPQRIAGGSRWWPALGGVWLLGASVCLLGWRGRRARYVRLGHQGEVVRSGPAIAVLESWRGLLGVRRQVRLLRSSAAIQPFTYGIWRPRIVIPESLLDSKHESLLDAVLGHEMAHVRRLDDGRLFLHQIVRAIYFFHPVAWWAVARLAEEREMVCDQMVLAQGRLDPKTYGRALLQVLSWNQDPVPAVVGLGSNYRRIAMRMRSLLDRDLTMSTYRRGGRLRHLAMALAAVFFLPLAASTEEAPLLAVDCEVPGELRNGEVEGGARWLAHPLPGARTTSDFGPRQHPLGIGEPRHHGIDLVGGEGQPIQAPLDGVVELSTTEIEGREHLGTVVVVDHGGGLRTLYAHLDRALVKTGQRIEPGELLGFPGATGKVTGPHLHFEVLFRGEPVNPDFWIRREDC